MNQQAANGHNGYVDADMFDLGGFLRVLSRSVRYHKGIVIWTVVLTLVIVTWYVYAWPPVYRVVARLHAEQDFDPARDQFYSNWQVFRKDNPRDEVQLFTAGAVLREVIEKNHLTYDDVYHPFMAHAGYLWEKSWLGRNYTWLKSKLVPDPEAPDTGNKELGRTMEGLKAGILLTSEGDSHVATLQVKGPSRRVSDVANSLIDSYLEYRSRRHTEEARQATDVLNREAARAFAELSAVRDKREAFARENGLMVAFQKENLDVQQLTGLESGIANQKAQIQALEASLRKVDEQLQSENPVKTLSSTKDFNAVRENGLQRRLELQAQLIGLRERYREDSQEVQEAKAILAKLDALIAQEPEKIDRNVTEGINTVRQQLTVDRNHLLSELEGTRASLASLEETAAQMRGHLTQLPGVMAEDVDLNREYDIAAEKYKQLVFRKMQSEVSAAAIEAAPASVKVVDYALPPSSKYWPRLKYLYPGALIAGLILGMIAAVLRSLTSGRLMQDHLDRGRIAAPVFATIALGGHPRVVTVLPLQGGSHGQPAETPRGDASTDSSKQAGT